MPSECQGKQRTPERREVKQGLKSLTRTKLLGPNGAAQGGAAAKQASMELYITQAPGKAIKTCKSWWLTQIGF